MDNAFKEKSLKIPGLCTGLLQQNFSKEGLTDTHLGIPSVDIIPFNSQNAAAAEITEGTDAFLKHLR